MKELMLTLFRKREREARSHLMEANMRMKVSKSRVNARVISRGMKRCGTNDKLNVSQLSERILKKILLFFDRYRTVIYYRHEPTFLDAKTNFFRAFYRSGYSSMADTLSPPSPFSTISEICVHPERTLDKNRCYEKYELSQK